MALLGGHIHDDIEEGPGDQVRMARMTHDNFTVLGGLPRGDERTTPGMEGGGCVPTAGHLGGGIIVVEIVIHRHEGIPSNEGVDRDLETLGGCPFRNTGQFLVKLGVVGPNQGRYRTSTGSEVFFIGDFYLMVDDEGEFGQHRPEFLV